MLKIKVINQNDYKVFLPLVYKKLTVITKNQVVLFLFYFY